MWILAGVVLSLQLHDFRDQTQADSQTWWQAPLPTTESSHWSPNNFCVIVFRSFYWPDYYSSLGFQILLDGYPPPLFPLNTVSSLSRASWFLLWFFTGKVYISALSRALPFQHLSEAGGLLWAIAYWCHASLPHSLLVFSFIIHCAPTEVHVCGCFVSWTEWIMNL